MKDREAWRAAVHGVGVRHSIAIGQHLCSRGGPVGDLVRKPCRAAGWKGRVRGGCMRGLGVEENMTCRMEVKLE